MYLLSLANPSGTYDLDSYHFRGTASLEVDAVTYARLSVNPLFKGKIVSDPIEKKVIEAVHKVELEEEKKKETGVLEISDLQSQKKSYRRSKKGE